MAAYRFPHTGSIRKPEFGALLTASHAGSVASMLSIFGSIRFRVPAVGSLAVGCLTVRPLAAQYIGVKVIKHRCESDHIVSTAMDRLVQTVYWFGAGSIFSLQIMTSNFRRF